MDLTFLILIIAYIKLLLEKICFLKYFFRIRYNKDTTKSKVVIARAIADTKDDFDFLVFNDRPTLIGFKKENSVISKFNDNIFDVCPLKEEKVIKNKKIEDEENSTIIKAEEESIDNKQADDIIDSISMVTGLNAIGYSITKLTEELEDNSKFKCLDKKLFNSSITHYSQKL